MKKLLLAICCSLAQAGVAQFNPLQSQYMLNPIVVNPAYAGSHGMLSAAAAYRKQWVGINGSPETFSFSAHLPLRNPHFNFGMSVIQDNIAVLHFTSVSAIYAYRFFLPHFSFAAGIAPGIILESAAWNSVFTNQPDAAFDGITARQTFYTADAGLYGNGKRFFMGLSSRAVFSKTHSGFSGQPVMFYTGYRFGEKEHLSCTPSVLLRMIPGSFYQADLNVLVYLQDRIGLGISYRLADAVNGLLDIRVNDQLRIGYSYDLPISHLSTYTTGSHELTLRYDFNYTVRANSPRNL